jgi:hypothetical protein
LEFLINLCLLSPILKTNLIGNFCHMVMNAAGQQTIECFFFMITDVTEAERLAIFFNA